MKDDSTGAECLNCVLLDSLARSGAGGSDVGQGEDEPSSADAASPSTGLRRYQHYEILTHEDGSLWELGHGAMGITYKAIDVNLRVPVALKVINARYSGHAAARQRFLREARAAARLRHPNVASVFHFGTIIRRPAFAEQGSTNADQNEQGECFYTMEFVEGETLEERLRRTGPFEVKFALEIALQITRALSAAEKRGLVHRDLKPANIMLADEGEASPMSSVAPRPRSELGEAWVKVIDFGLAKAIDVTVTGEDSQHQATVAPITLGGFLGTPHFASPEQFEQRQIDTRSDIFSLGTILWYLLTGGLPIQGRSLEELHDQKRRGLLPLEQLAKAQVPKQLRDLLGSMLAANPSDRPASAMALHARLEHSLVALPTPCVSGQAGLPNRRLTILRAVLIILVLALLAAGGVAYRMAQAPPNPAVETTTTVKAAPVSGAVPTLYVTNYKSNTVGAYDAITGTALNPAFLTKLSGPNGIVVSGSNLYVANETDGTIGHYNAQTGAAINLSLVKGLKAATGLKLAGENLYVTDDGTLVVDVFNATTGAAVKVPLISGGFVDPDNVLVSGNTLYVLDVKAGTVGMYDVKTGSILNATFITGLDQPQGLALAGHILYVVERGGKAVRKYDATTGALLDAAFITGLNTPYDLALYGNTLYVSDYQTNTVDTYDATTGKLLQAGFITGLDGANFLTVVPPLPVVSVVATIPRAAVGRGQDGEFTLKLSAPQDHDVFVSYTVDGTAVSNRDFVGVKTTIKVEAGQTSRSVKIIPMERADPRRTLVVELVLLSREGYTVGTADKAEIALGSR